MLIVFKFYGWPKFIEHLFCECDRLNEVPIFLLLPHEHELVEDYLHRKDRAKLFELRIRENDLIINYTNFLYDSNIILDFRYVIMNQTNELLLYS